MSYFLQLNEAKIDSNDHAGAPFVSDSDEEADSGFDPYRNGEPFFKFQRGTLKTGSKHTINALFEGFDYTETSSPLR